MEPPKPSLTEIAAKATVAGIPVWGGALTEIISGLQSRRTYAAEHALGAISERVGWDAMLSIAERDPEIEALLWLALQAITATGVESKRALLQKVVVNAMTSDEPIDPQQVQAAALAELDAPHIRALVRLIEAERLDVEQNEDVTNLLIAVGLEPIPVIATLIRTGALFPGGTAQGRERNDKRVVTPGVTPFGRELIADLRDNGYEEDHAARSS